LTGGVALIAWRIGMDIYWNVALAFVSSYIIGSIPFGLVIVWIASGTDLRNIESGRTGGTNAMRAAGFLAGLFTAVFDVGKGVVVVWIAEALVPGVAWVKVVAALLAVMGHNYSVFLIEKRVKGGIRLRGGAGGATALGGAIGLWPATGLIILPLGLLVFLLIGYASVTTMSITVFATLIFLYQALQGSAPWEYVGYGIGVFIIVVWALRPNLKRLREGNERVVGLRAYLHKRKEARSETEKSQKSRESGQENHI
jgi:acyl phosphate:glycerol-3-phosphate acyltransferase